MIKNLMALDEYQKTSTATNSYWDQIGPLFSAYIGIHFLRTKKIF